MVLTSGSVCLFVIFNSYMMHKYAHRIELADNPNYAGRSADDHIKYFFAFFLLWCLSQISASYLAVTLSNNAFSFRERKYNYTFRLFTLVLIFSTIWFLEPWFIFLTGTSVSVNQANVKFFKLIFLAANTLIAIVCLLKDSNISSNLSGITLSGKQH